MSSPLPFMSSSTSIHSPRNVRNAKHMQSIVRSERSVTLDAVLAATVLLMQGCGRKAARNLDSEEPGAPAEAGKSAKQPGVKGIEERFGETP